MQSRTADRAHTSRPATRHSPGVVQTGCRGAAALPGTPLPPKPHRTALSSCHWSHFPLRSSLPNCSGMLQDPPGGRTPPGAPLHPSGLGPAGTCGMFMHPSPGTPLHLLALGGTQGWADLRPSPNSPQTVAAKPKSKLGNSPSWCFSSCSTHSTHIAILVFPGCMSQPCTNPLAHTHHRSHSQLPCQPWDCPRQKLPTVGNGRASFR